MALSKFDPDLLEFMYLLTRKQRYMNSLEISKYLSSCGKRVTDRTVRRWFDYLHKYKFDYFPYPRYNTLGLAPVWILTDFNENVLKIIPYKVAIVSGIDFHNLERCLLCLYLIPPNHLSDFKKLWSVALSRRIVKHCHIFDISSAIAFFSPFHKIVNEDGLVNFPEDYDIDNSYFTGLLKKCLETEKKFELDKRIIMNPLTVPIILEYFRGHMSSRSIWNSFERKLGAKVWDYINAPRIKRERKKGAGIRLVQEIMKGLHDNFYDFFQQVRVVYYPFYTNENNMFYMILKLRRRKDILPLSELLSRHSLSIVAYPPLEKESKIIVYYVITNKKETLNIVGDLIQPYIDKSFDNKIVYEDVEKSLKYGRPLKIDYHELFDPETCTWKFDAKAYAKKLESAWKAPAITQR